MEIRHKIDLRLRPVRPPRKILCIVALAGALLGGAVAVAPAGDRAGPSDGARPAADLVEARLAQAGRKLILTIRTATPVALADLDRLPPSRGSGSRLLCLALSRPGHRGERRLCLGGKRANHRRVGVELVNAAGRTTRSWTAAARVKRPERRKLVLALDPQLLSLPPHRYRWRVLENRRGCGQCAESLPARGARVFRLRPVRAVGCTGGGAGVVSHGPRDRNVVALTFDDGPGTLTESFLAVLRDKRVDATFFELGQEVGGREATMRRILRDGNEIANHSTHHEAYPGYADLAETSGLIRAATHFRPCLFRPPGGAVDDAVIEAAARAGMKSVLWDVDPSDWSNPGSGAVYSRVVDAVAPGSIVVMHDGGGDRSGTLAALPSIIDTLRGRGYRMTTVTELLGGRLVYRPYG